MLLHVIVCYCGVCPLPRPRVASAVEPHKLWPSAVEPLRLRPSAVKAVEPPSCDNQRLNCSSFDQKRLNRSSVTDHSCHHKHQGRQDSFFLSPHGGGPGTRYPRRAQPAARRFKASCLKAAAAAVQSRSACSAGRIARVTKAGSGTQVHAWMRAVQAAYSVGG